MTASSVQCAADDRIAATTRQRFSPYTDNGGSCVAIAGKDCVLIAADTRQSEGYLILSRNEPKTKMLTRSTALGCTGFQGDASALMTRISFAVENYHSNHRREPSVRALSQLLSVTLYYKRFFPYYAGCLLAGLDPQGHGAVYSYDPVGSFERYRYAATGSSSALLLPFLDSRVGFKNTTLEEDPPMLSRDEIVAIAHDAFISATERDIYTGDRLHITLITVDKGREDLFFDLRRD